MEFNERLKELRESKKFTQEQLAKQIGRAKSTITGYEKGNRIPDLLMLKRIAKVFNVSLDYLTCMDDDPTPPKISSPGFAETAEPDKYKDITDILDTLNEAGIYEVKNFAEFTAKKPEYKKPCESEVLLTKEEA